MTKNTLKHINLANFYIKVLIIDFDINGLIYIGIALCFILYMSHLLIHSIHLFSLSNIKKTFNILHLSFGKYGQKWTFHFNIESMGKIFLREEWSH